MTRKRLGLVVLSVAAVAAVAVGGRLVQAQPKSELPQACRSTANCQTCLISGSGTPVQWAAAIADTHEALAAFAPGGAVHETDSKNGFVVSVCRQPQAAYVTNTVTTHIATPVQVVGVARAPGSPAPYPVFVYQGGYPNPIDPLHTELR